MADNNWFENWFDSEYYHLLYKNRNNAEAQLFMDNITQFLHVKPGNTILDLACGKGRHSIYLNKKGYNVQGVDLSANSILQAKEFENNTLHFSQCDMRELSFQNQFDYVLNMFTSFGYFHHRTENITVLEKVHRSLKSKGTFVIDFLNAYQVIHQLVPTNQHQIENVQFDIERYVEDHTIVKKINVHDQAFTETFQERVTAFELSDFESMFSETGFKLIATFGNYQLDEFNAHASDRLILVAQKTT